MNMAVLLNAEVYTYINPVFSLVINYVVCIFLNFTLDQWRLNQGLASGNHYWRLYVVCRCVVYWCPGQ